MEIKKIGINGLKPYGKNAKKHPEAQIAQVANSIEQFGWKQPLVIDKDNTIIIGHCRWLAAKQLGYDTVPCVIADDLTEVQVKALRLVDNKTNESEWDFALLDAELDGIFDIDMAAFGFDLTTADEYDDVFSLPDGDKQPFQTLSFTLSDGQADFVKEQLAAMKKTKAYEDYGVDENANSNGNALYLVVLEWERQRK